MNKFLYALAGLAVVFAACAPPTTPQPVPRATPTLNPTVQAAVAELFWIAADIAGIARTTPFDDAKRMLGDALFTEYDLRLIEIERFGVDPFNDWPYCISAILGAHAIASLNLSKSPVDAAPDVNTAMEVIMSLEVEARTAREFGKGVGSRTESKQKCDQFEDEIRAKRR